MEEDDSYVPSDLTAEERQELENIRRRKQELLADIQRLKEEIAEVANEIENLGSTEERKNMQRNKQVAMGRKKFNMDPKKGIQFLIENDLLKDTCEDIAQFLYKGEGLNKTAIGDYLGERDEFNLQVLHAFVELHEFTDLNLVQALRQFLWSFRLPGEAQKIDRMMEAFAQRYCQCNSGVFQSTDTCYVLSFAIIMLNTSLHNPNVKDKPTVERFIAMNRGINDGGDLPEELLRNLYESIKNEPFKIPEDDGNDLTHTFFNPDREGWLLKLGSVHGNPGPGPSAQRSSSSSRSGPPAATLPILLSAPLAVLLSPAPEGSKGLRRESRHVGGSAGFPTRPCSHVVILLVVQHRRSPHDRVPAWASGDTLLFPPAGVAELAPTGAVGRLRTCAPTPHMGKAEAGAFVSDQSRWQQDLHSLGEPKFLCSDMMT
nr:cytohesin-1 isoform X2 [Marmota flaviventris]